MKQQKVFIVGAAGQVGASAAYAMTLKQTVSEIVLIDLHPDVAEGQAMDITDAAAFTDGVTVRVGDYSEIDTDDIVVITGGAAQKPGQTRLDLLNVNAGIIRDIVGKVMQNGKQVYLVLVTNPVDVMTYVAMKASGLPRHRVFGTGTTLESARLRAALGERLGVSAAQINAFALGEHGDSTFSALSQARVGAIPLAEYPNYTHEVVATIDEDVSKKVYHIINTKHATYYGIGQVISEIVAALRRPLPSMFPVTSVLEGEYGLQDVAVSVPSMISTKGVVPVEGYPLTEDEYAKLQHSAQVIRTAINDMQS
ncbi:MAG: L-lactate dehydrogenase [Candidatus Saccharibacteria bacterium]|nr:L-lactate dehydrogenase [Candidatus Saccharibacteria bacterium]